MTDLKIKQNISAFMDAEEDLDNSLSKQDKICWERYHLISEAIKNNTPELMADNIANNVSKSIANESAILAPANIKSSPFKSKRLAIAASVAGAVAIGSVVWFQDNNDNLATVAKFSDDTNSPATHLIVKNGKQIERLNDPRLNAYITQHDAAVLQSKSTNIPQVRIVNFPE